MSAATPAAGPGVAPPAVQAKNGLGVAALVCGIVGLVLSLIPLLFVVGLPLAILAIVFGFVGMRRVKRGEATNRGMAITGVVTGLIALVIAIIAIASIGAAANDLDNELQKIDETTYTDPAAFQRAQQKVNHQEHVLVHRSFFITNR